MVDFAALGFFMVQHESLELERRFHREASNKSHLRLVFTGDGVGVGVIVGVMRELMAL